MQFNLKPRMNTDKHQFQASRSLETFLRFAAMHRHLSRVHLCCHSLSQRIRISGFGLLSAFGLRPSDFLSCRALLIAVCATLASSANAITVAALQNDLAAGQKLALIDVRPATLYEQGHIPGAINIPASLCPFKNLPALGKVIVYDEGLGRRGGAEIQSAVAALNKKPGITAEILSGGYAAWQSAHGQTTAASGLRPEAINYVTYVDLQAMSPADVVLVDLRTMTKPVLRNSTTLSDLNQEFPGRRVRKDLGPDISNAVESPLVILIDSADGSAETAARLLKAKGVQRYAVLLGGELTILRKGKPGLERSGAVHRGVMPPQTAQSTGQTGQ
jgi:rhodanese-related sulfurtransferase